VGFAFTFAFTLAFAIAPERRAGGDGAGEEGTGKGEERRFGYVASFSKAISRERSASHLGRGSSRVDGGGGDAREGEEEVVEERWRIVVATDVELALLELRRLDCRSTFEAGMKGSSSGSSAAAAAAAPLIASLRFNRPDDALVTTGGVEEALNLAGSVPSRMRHCMIASVRALGDWANQSEMMPISLQELQRVG